MNRANRTDSGELLSRAEFRRQVLSRSQGRCIFCAQVAIDAHHILERKLFEDGGYRAGNGAAVCAAHHWLCETTELSVTEVRLSAGVLIAVLPAGFQLAATYDKWGNRIWPTGLRSWGPLAHDTGARRALAAGGFLGVLMPASYSEQTLPVLEQSSPGADRLTTFRRTS